MLPVKRSYSDHSSSSQSSTGTSTSSPAPAVHAYASAVPQKYLAIPASSAPSERVFSKSKHLVMSCRSKYDVERVERLIMMKFNKIYDD